MASTNVQDLIKAINAVDSSAISVEERHQLGAAAQQLIANVEQPWDTIKRLVWVQVRMTGRNACELELLVALADTVTSARGAGLSKDTR